MEKKKFRPIARVKDWWNGLTSDQQWLCVVGLWTFDGALFGSLITAKHKDKQIEQAEKIGASKGYILGQIDAYKDVAQNPYKQMELGMTRLEQQGKAKHF